MPRLVKTLKNRILKIRRQRLPFKILFRLREETNHRFVYPIRYASTSRAQSRPSRIARTTSD